MSPPIQSPTVAWPAGRPHGTERAYFGIITAVNVPPGGALSAPPPQIRYSAKAIMTEDEVVLTDAVPVGRPTQNGESQAAGANSLCLIFIRNIGPTGGIASLYVLSEYIVGDLCPSSLQESEGTGTLHFKMAGGGP